MKAIIFLALLSAVAFAAPSLQGEEDLEQYSHPKWDDANANVDNAHDILDTELVQTAKLLKKVAPQHLKADVSTIHKHAELIQKARSYNHNFASSAAAIKAALSSLLSQLNAGHNHDKSVLATSHRDGNAATANAKNTGKNKCRDIREKACPIKRKEEEAAAKKRAALNLRNKVGSHRMCGSLSTTWDDMDVTKPVPRFGTEIRNEWDKIRAQYTRAHNKYVAATKAHQSALNAHARHMASFTTAVKIEAKNAVSTCKNAHSQYNTLKRDVASNVATRKQVFVATLVIQCYANHLSSNADAKACADRARRASTSQWNISPGRLAACSSEGSLQNSFGPLSWKPSRDTCELRHWHEKAHKAKLERDAKERNTKERAAKKERNDKAEKKVKAEKKAKADERSAKEKTAKEKAAKAKLERDNKAKERDAKARKERAEKAAEKKVKADEKAKKERDTKEKAAKAKVERDNKAKVERDSKERTSKENAKHAAFKASVPGYVCGSSNSRGLPGGWASDYKCDVSHGRYTLSSSAAACSRKPSCLSFSFDKRVHHPCFAKTATGRPDNESRHPGSRRWIQCKKLASTVRASFDCKTNTVKSNNAGVIYIGPKSGYTTTGGGMNNHYRSWNKLSAFEEMMPEGNRFRCDTGFGAGQLTCYNQACKVDGGLTCVIKSKRFTGSGRTTINVPSGYTMTGGGVYNHYRSFNQKAGFEESYPYGNGWRGDMGFGWGDFTTYVRGCKINKSGNSQKLSCTTAVSGRGNSGIANCPGGYKITGCGIFNHYRSWNAKAGFEQTHPHGNGCLCDSGFGHGDMQCYARCCKVA